MLKIDKPIVDEFLGRNVDVTFEQCSRLKYLRLYGKGTPVDKLICVLTPMIAEDERFIKRITETRIVAGAQYDTYKRGKNTVLVFKRC